MRACQALTCLLLLVAGLYAQAGEPAATLDSPLTEPIRAASQALESKPDDPKTLARRAGLYAQAEQPAQAIADLDRLLKLDPERADAWDLRGSEHFKLGYIDESIADFDQYVKLRPDQDPWHWKRGISYYYAGKFDQGRRQFEGYQTVDDADVENAVWRYLCMARGVGVAKARDQILRVKSDRRVPMSEIYKLFAGQATTEDVMIAARSGSPSPAELNSRLFYAHLYLGLYAEVAGDAAEAKRQLKAATEHKIGHYMWNVADVHLKRLDGHLKRLDAEKR